MFRFTIRDVLWLTVVIALIAAWRTHLARQQSEFRDVIRNRIVEEDLGEATSLIGKAKDDP